LQNQSQIFCHKFIIFVGFINLKFILQQTYLQYSFTNILGNICLKQDKKYYVRTRLKIT